MRDGSPADDDLPERESADGVRRERSGRRFAHRDADRRRRSPEREDDVTPEVEALRAELERTERRLQYVIDHYERLLSEKNRKLAREPADDGGLPDVSNAVRWITDR